MSRLFAGHWLASGDASAGGAVVATATVPQQRQMVWCASETFQHLPLGRQVLSMVWGCVRGGIRKKTPAGGKQRRTDKSGAVRGGLCETVCFFRYFVRREIETKRKKERKREREKDEGGREGGREGRKEEEKELQLRA